MALAVKGIFARQPLAWTARETDGPTLRRTLGWPALTAIGLGTMLGGIFPTIGAGAHAAGPAVILAYVLSGLVSLCVALCYAEFASMVPVAGSAYTYAYATLGEVVAWVIGWDLILEYGLSVAPTASSWSAYAQQVLSGIGITLPTVLQTGAIASGQIDVIAALIVLVITVLVAIGIRESANVNGVLVVFQIVTMLVFIAATATSIHGALLHPFAPNGFHGVVAGTALVFYAYIGFDTVTVASEEANDPVRQVPIGIMLALVIGGLLYVVLALCTVGALSYTKLSEGAAMLDAVRAATKNPVVFWIVALGGVAGNTTVMRHLAARADPHLLRHGARPHAAPRRREDPSTLSYAGDDDDDHRRDRRRAGRTASAGRFARLCKHRDALGVRDRLCRRLGLANRATKSAPPVSRATRVDLHDRWGGVVSVPDYWALAADVDPLWRVVRHRHRHLCRVRL